MTLPFKTLKVWYSGSFDAYCIYLLVEVDGMNWMSIYLIFKDQFRGRSSRSPAHAAPVRRLEVLVSAELARPLFTLPTIRITLTLAANSAVSLHLCLI